MGGRIKAMVVDDSGFMRIVISDILRKDPDIDVIATAVNGQDGVAKAKLHQPDVVIADMVMPEYDGLYLVKNIMQEGPRPVILLSSLDKANPRVFEALSAGAVNFIDKPQSTNPSKIKFVDKKLIEAVKEAYVSNVDSKAVFTQKKANTYEHTFSDQVYYQVIVIGASTGGPGSIEHIIKNLPSNLNIPMVIAQHMPSRFLSSFATRLDLLSPLTVKLAEDNEILKPGHVYVASGDTNTRVIRTKGGTYRFRSTDEQYKEYNYPSIDCLFESVAKAYGDKSIAVVMTGMGRDGTMGAREIFDKGGMTIAQDKSSSVVFGMPKSAIDAGVIKNTIKLKEVPAFLVSCLS